MKNILVAKNQCCGCSACQDVCPKNAITMVEDKEGFLYPAIYETKCVDCGMCYKVCPNINVKPKESLLKAYAAYYKNEEIRFKSSSGGIFSLIAEDILKKNGIVYGAAFDENFEVAFNDVDYCLRVRELGKTIVFHGFVELYHYESRSRGLEDTPEKKERFNREAGLFRKRWKSILDKGDPYYNPNLTLEDSNCTLKW